MKIEVGTNILYNADCFEIFPLIEDNSIDLILCDLPYGITANTWDSVLDFNRLWKEYERILSSNGNILLFASGLFTYKLALSNEKLFRYELIWKKSKCGSPLTAKYMPLKKHENILVFGKSNAIYNPQMREGTPYKRKYTPNKNNNMQYGIKGVETDNKGTRHPITVLEFPQKWRRQDQLHPTQKPVELLEYLIRQYSNENSVILDNCFGSNSCGVAAQLNGRKYIGIEKEEKYFNIGKLRVQSTIENIFNIL